MALPVNEIERTAAEWAAKMDGVVVSADLARAFDAWIAADPRHLGAYLKVEAALANVSRLGGEAERRRRAAAVISLDAARQSRRKYLFAGAIAASLAVVVAGGAVWRANSFDAAYETRVGELKTVGLPDGSSITLNTGTRVHVHYNLLARDVDLDRGEALFDVAKHKVRPFVVAAGDAAVRAVGTSFAVARIDPRPLTVTVREGIVAISERGLPADRTVTAGSLAIACAGGFDTKAAHLTQDLAWLDGQVFFRHQTLATAVHEFERYSSVRIIIEDPAIARRTVTGMYVATDPVGFARAVAVLMDLQLEVDGAKIYLKPKA